MDKREKGRKGDEALLIEISFYATEYATCCTNCCPANPPQIVLVKFGLYADK